MKLTACHGSELVCSFLCKVLSVSVEMSYLPLIAADKEPFMSNKEWSVISMNSHQINQLRYNAMARSFLCKVLSASVEMSYLPLIAADKEPFMPNKEWSVISMMARARYFEP